MYLYMLTKYPKNFILSIFINNPRGDEYSFIWYLYDHGKTKNSWCYSYFTLIQIMNSTRSFLLSLGKAKNSRWYITRSFLFSQDTNALISKMVLNQVINEISENASSRKLKNQNWFSQSLRALVHAHNCMKWLEEPVPVFQIPG